MDTEKWARTISPSGDEAAVREIAAALRAAFFQGRREAVGVCRATLDALDARTCCCSTVRKCIENIEALDNPFLPANLGGAKQE